MNVKETIQHIFTNGNTIPVTCRLLAAEPQFPYTVSDLVEVSFQGYCRANLVPTDYDTASDISLVGVTGIVTFNNTGSDTVSEVWGLAVVSQTTPEQILYTFEFSDPSLSMIPPGTQKYTITLEAVFLGDLST